LLRKELRTDMTKLMFDCRNFANAPKVQLKLSKLRDLVRCHAALIGGQLLAVRDKLSVPCSRVKQTWIAWIL
jgi:hypothetical protein